MHSNQISECVESKLQTNEARKSLKLAHKLAKHSRKRRRPPGYNQKD